ncbi:MAG: anthranilate phosphoribosyltransferase, partial [Oricola sp.]|nr:anthranilate phosphoribosyltransferase [Oricola sp.]
MSAFTPHLARAVSGSALSAAEMRAAMDALFSGEASEVEVAGFLAALRARGETVEEIAAAAQAMRAHALKVDAPDDVIDTCGTGGDGKGTYNVSSASAFVIAACGVPVAKHGNRSLSSKSGSSQVLEELGVKVDLDAAGVAACVKRANIGFMMAPVYHAAMKNVGPVRQALGFRTIFNLLGPLANPAGTKRQ